MSKIVSSVLILILILIAVRADEQFCRSKGFDVDSLLCGTCSRLQDITSAQVGAECLKCCQSPFDRVKLSASQAALMRNVGLSEFLNARKNKFGKAFELDVTSQREDVAKLILKKDGKEQLSLRVTHWSANDLEDYIGQYFAKVA